MIDVLKAGLPANAEAEAAVLGAILDSDTCFPMASAVLNSDDFSAEKHKRIFLRMQDLYEAGSPIGLVSLAAKLKDCNQLEAIGGLTYLAKLNDGMSSVLGIDQYMRIVKEKSTLRQYILVHQALIQEALLNGDSQEIINRAEKSNRELLGGVMQDRRLATADEVIHKAGGLDEFYNAARLQGIPTPWPQVSRYLTWKPKELTILAARPSVGKTAAALQIAKHAARVTGKTVPFFSLEMGSDTLLMRMYCTEARVDSNRMRRGELDRDERDRLRKATNYINSLPIRYDDQTACTVPAIHAALRRLQAIEEVSLVVVDYLQLMSAPGRSQNRTEAVSEISRGLKLAATEFNVPFVVLSQLTRACEHEGRRPQLSDLRDSGSLEQDANNVIFLSLKEKDYGPVRPVELSIAKQRNGSVGTFNMVFHAIYCRLEEETPDERQQNADFRSLAAKG